MKPEVYTQKLVVPTSAIDERNHVNNLNYLQWCLRIAESHWKEKASPRLLQEYIWYVVRHEIDYKSQAFEGEELLLKTWVTSAQGVRSERCYTISRTKESQLLVEAKTLWCLLDAKTGKPTKITEEIRNLFL